MSDPTISAFVGQLAPSFDVDKNLQQMLELLSHTQDQDLIVLPEGMLTGYSEDMSFLERIDQNAVERALKTLTQAAQDKQAHLFFGACLHESGQWFNTTVYAGPDGQTSIYKKINLAEAERGVFTAGSSLSVLPITIGGETVRIGIQMCREIRFPEQWQYLARQGAQVFAYLTNAVGDDAVYPVWKSHLISRAAENQRFILSANVAEPAQKCPSMIISPKGKVLWEADSHEPEWHRATLDLAEVSDWYLSQSRQDVVSER